MTRPEIVSTGWAIGLKKGTSVVVDDVRQNFPEGSGPLPWAWFPKTPWPFSLNYIVADGAMQTAVFRTRAIAMKEWTRSHGRGTPFAGRGRVIKVTVEIHTETRGR